MLSPRPNERWKLEFHKNPAPKEARNTLNMITPEQNVSRIRNQIVNHVQFCSDTGTYHTARRIAIIIIQSEVEFCTSPDINGPMEKQSQIVVKPLDLQNRSFSSVYCQLKWFSKLMGEMTVIWWLHSYSPSFLNQCHLACR